MKPRDRGRSSLWLIGILGACAVTCPASPAGPPPGVFPASLESLAQMDAAQLEQLYRSAPGAVMPAGRVKGRAILMPGRRLGPAVSKAAGVVWQGKVFDGSGSATNRFFGVPAIRAQVYAGSSWLDGGPALILDYSQTSHVYARYRDEIRQVGPGLYLGLMYARKEPRPKLSMYFALQDIAE